MGKAETGQYNSFQRHTLCWPHCALLETTLIPTIHLNPTCNKSPMLIKAFFFWSRLLGAATHRCLEKPHSSHGRLSFVPSIRQPAELLGELVGVCWRLQPWSFSVLFSLFFFTIYGCFQQIRGREGGGREGRQGIHSGLSEGTECACCAVESGSQGGKGISFGEIVYVQGT